MERVVFDRLYWDPLDLGTISDEQVVAACKERLPERLWNGAEQSYYRWIYNLPEIPGMRELVQELKSRGFPLFLLSNISTYFASHADEIPILRLFDRCFFTAEYGIVKPSREIFSLLCTQCEIRPEETLFIDDSPKNIAGAQAFGLQTRLFDGDVTALRNDLSEWL